MSFSRQLLLAAADYLTRCADALIDAMLFIFALFLIMLPFIFA